MTDIEKRIAETVRECIARQWGDEEHACDIMAAHVAAVLVEELGIGQEATPTTSAPTIGAGTTTGARLASIMAAHGSEFTDGLQRLINKCSLENGCDLPDYTIAEYLIECYTALCNTRRPTHDSTITWHEPECGLSATPEGTP